MTQTNTAGGNAKDAADQNFDYMFKLLIIGNSSVGKTSFLFRYADDSFTSAFVSTVGIDFKVKTVFRQDKRVKLQIWDTAGQERYRTITTAYYRGAMGFILMYDITNEESFNAVQDWCTQIKMYSWDNAQVVLVGNKCDLEQDRAVTLERGQRLADQLGKVLFKSLVDVRFKYLFLYNLFGIIMLSCCIIYIIFSRVLQIKIHSWEKTPVILVGNKCDMADERVIQTENAKRFTNELGTNI
ncbi:hypothetical protein I4U23_010088 [Adineta vaga]|nr:hypothetical protein I4U23_010088 [Adineta vaga]